MKFKIGDKVKVKKWGRSFYFPWMKPMDKAIGKIGEIISGRPYDNLTIYKIKFDGAVDFKGNDYYYIEECVSLANTKKKIG